MGPTETQTDSQQTRDIADAEKGIYNADLRGDNGIADSESSGTTGNIEAEGANNGDNECWNYPRSNVVKTLSTFWAFFVMGANDSAYGVSSLFNPSFQFVGLNYTNDDNSLSFHT